MKAKSIHLVDSKRRGRKENKAREEAEKNLYSGISLKEWDEVKDDPAAHKEFQRVKKVLKAVDKCDGLIETTINMYCLLFAECKELQKDIKGMVKWKNEALGMEDKMEISKHILATEKLLLAKRNQLFAIQKENSMTIQGMLRAIPKQQLETDEVDDPMESLLKRRQ